MTKDAVENYGEEWRNVVMEVTHTANKYMPAAEFFAKGKPEGYHPGYDEGTGCNLYDLKRVDNGEPVNFSLYAWEVMTVGEVRK
jgi:hypothetical protein